MATKTHYSALKDGVVVATRSSHRVYTHAVIYKCLDGWFATFHGSLAAARRQASSSEYYTHPTREVVPTVTTVRPTNIGDVVIAQGVL